jgi:hypothetical protein
VTVRLDQDRAGVALVAPDGRLLVWSDGVLRGYDVGGPLSSATAPAPVPVEGRTSSDLLAITRDGAVVLIGGLAAGGPRALARLEVRALRDGRITIGDLDGDGASEAVVLADPTTRYAHGVFGDPIEAASLAVIGVRPFGLDLRARFALPAPAVFEDRAAILAALGAGAAPAALLARSTPGQGAAVVALGWRQGGVAVIAEGPGFGQSHRWTHVIGATDLTGDGVPEIAAVAAPHVDGVLTAYRRRGSALVAVASAAGYASHAPGSSNLEQAVVADLDGDRRPEIALPRQSREALVGLELRGERFVERWTVDFKSPLTSNLVVADVDGDGRLDLAVATRRGVHVLLSVP